MLFDEGEQKRQRHREGTAVDRRGAAGQRGAFDPAAQGRWCDHRERSRLRRLEAEA